jgi:hypothetical protein
MPPTCGRISAMTGATVRPDSSVLSASVSGFSVTAPTSFSGAAAALALLAESVLVREQPASVAMAMAVNSRAKREVVWSGIRQVMEVGKGRGPELSQCAPSSSTMHRGCGGGFTRGLLQLQCHGVDCVTAM